MDNQIQPVAWPGVNGPINPRHFEILAEAMAEVKATSDGLSDQPIADIVAGCIEEIEALITPPVPPTKGPEDDLIAAREAAADPALSDGAVRALCLMRDGEITDEVREWARSALNPSVQP